MATYTFQELCKSYTYLQEKEIADMYKVPYVNMFA